MTFSELWSFAAVFVFTAFFYSHVGGGRGLLVYGKWPPNLIKITENLSHVHVKGGRSMEQGTEKELLFCDTFAHEGEEVRETFVRVKNTIWREQLLF